MRTKKDTISQYIIIRPFFFLILLNLVTISVFSQELLPGSGYNNFKIYSIDQGLPQSTVYCLIQDKRGYIWVGTEGAGVCRFDGRSFKTFNSKHGLAGNNVRSLIEDSRGYIWVGSDNGVSYYDGFRFRIISTAQGLSGNTVLSLYEDSNHHIWAGTNDGGVNKITLLKKDTFRIHSYSTKDGLSSDFIFDIYEDPRKRIWLATFYGGINILTFDKNESTIEYLRKDQQLPSDLITAIEPDRNGNLWFGTYDAGAFRMINPYSDNFGRIDGFNPSNGLNDVMIWDVFCNRSGDIWFSTNEGGAVRFHNNQIITYNNKNGLPNNQIMRIMQDNEGNMWFGTYGNGLVKFSGDHFTHFTETSGLSSNEIFDITEDPSGTIWLATQGGGINSIRFLPGGGMRINVFSIKEGLAGNYVKALETDHNGFLWIGTDAGLTRCIPGDLLQGKGKVENFSTANGLADNKVKCLLADKNSNIWCGGQQGITTLKKGAPLYLDKDYGLPDNEIQTIIQSRDDAIWIGTFKGLGRYDYKVLRTFDEVEGLTDKRVNALAEDYMGNIWIGTDGGGLFRLDTHTSDTLPIRLFADDSLLSSSIIYSLFFLDTNILLTGTNKGFDKITLESTRKVKSITTYDNSNGFTGVENNQNAIYRDSRGNIWFGTVKGVTRYTPAAEVPVTAPPLTHITDLKLFYKHVDWKTKADSVSPWFLLPRSLELSYSDNHLTFSYAGISLGNPQRVMYRYRLEGHEEEWSPLRSESEVTYSALQPGDYTFMVVAINEAGISSTEPARFSFIVNPPWYRTTWFYILCIIITVAGVWLFIKIRERRLKEEKRILEQLVAERTREVVMQKEEIEEKNKTLTQANIEISEQKKIIEEKNKDITDSINYAKRIQQALLPRDDDVRQLLPDSFVLFRPKDIVSGDFYWINQKDDIAYFTASDCTGHGVPGAFVSMIIMELLNETINVKSILQPGNIFTEVRTGLIRSLKQTGGVGQQKDGMDSALCSIQPGKNGKTIMQCGSGNNALCIVSKSDKPLVLHSENPETGEETKELTYQISFDGYYLYEIPADKQPIGISDSKKPFTNYSTELQKGDCIYITTDGFEDQFGGPKGKKYMRKKLKELWLNMQSIPILEQKDFLNKTFEEWKGELDQVDDVCIFGVRV
ncbi:MAG: SpoIIE family protein phosphatase [Bacteroidetes bacterium]|nr:SpoIIE family protein phosphatase [Bacteroidota bacterium]